ncbi:hypothetical protein LOD50_10945 [Xylella fastidiosa subsp. multiplex]|uniref:Uncharacterized protein n=1 Tax=Xylella fastidiosa subsp. multiplex TaxID=644357 RepID=A0AAW6HZ03_XYLFS|nr:hypothetical protein [Xylella fastidiosa]MDC6409554.1 hypothetical protein [Xylella fastidiosa subsp. multiplex]MDD0936879.1 hypothetical protein [Xylella fastidiosa subsp. multiplex]MSS68107.1 hypothetical protein [Xylella fastidiosa subsp. multiplex]
MSNSEMKIQANALIPELVAELVALKQEAERFLSTQKIHTKVIYDVFDGAKLLTPETLARVNNAVMIAHQMTTNVQKRINALRDKLPEGYKDADGHFWNTITVNLLRDTHKDFDKTVNTAKKISGWASLKIDGTNF